MIRPPGIDELRTFCTAAESGSLGRAALRLNVTQPALSKRLAALERLAGARLLHRSPTGVTLTPAGHRLYEHARRLLEQAEVVESVLDGIGRTAGPLRLAASHSSAEAFAARVLAELGDAPTGAVEAVMANSQTVRSMVAEGAADLGVAASRPGGSPNPGVRELELADDEVICAVPRAHPWARLGRIGRREFLRTPMVLRDPQANARWTVEAVLRAKGMRLADPLAEAATPAAARREAVARVAPTLLSRRVLPTESFVPVTVDGLSFPRRYELVLPALGEPAPRVAALMDALRAGVEDPAAPVAA